MMKNEKLRVCVMIEWTGPEACYSLVNSECGRVLPFFPSEESAIAFAEEHGWEVY